MKFFLKCSLLFFSLLITACNDDPTSVGSNLIPDNEKVLFKEFDSQVNPITFTSSFYPKKVKLGSSDKLILGSDSFSESEVLMLFDITLADSLLARIKNNTLKVKKTWLNLFPNYTLGDKSLPFDFTIHQVRSKWNGATFNRDSTVQVDAANIKLSHNLTDTLITVDLKTDAVYEWLKRKADSTSAPRNYGLIFRPAAGTNRMVGFSARQSRDEELQPLLYVVLERSASVDTIFVTPFTDTYVLKNKNQIVSQDKILLQGSYAHSGTLLFDLSSFPKDIIVNKATLELSVDTLASADGSPKSDSIYIQMSKSLNGSILTADSNYSTILKRNKNLFSGDITWMVQKWIGKLSDNYGVRLSLADETSSAARIVLYGNKESNPLLRPRIKLVYTQKK